MSDGDDAGAEVEATDPSDAEAGAWALADDAVLAAVKAQLLGAVDVPVRLGKYEVERPIGSGAMGRILLARDPRLDRRVALKIVAPQLADLPEARARIVREARAMARLSDPHVAQVYEVAEEGPHLFVVMEYVDGQRLGAWLEARSRSVARILDVFVQAGRGLASTHAKGLVHRDFKPDNVMLEQGGRAKVVDFGLACGLGETTAGAGPLLETVEPLDAGLTATGAWLGTPAYMAPEQWTGEGVDARSDQFSFCVALYEALCGRRPFAGETAAAVHDAVHNDRPAPLRGTARVPRRIEAAILRGLRRDPEQRWPTMEPLLRALAPRSRATVAVVVPMVALVATAALATRGDPCADAPAPMDSVWNDEARGRLVTAVAEAETPWAGPTADAVTGHLDRAAEAWRQAARAVCAASDAPPESRRCLEYERGRLLEAVERVTGADPGVLVSAASHLELLPDARTCLQPATTGWLRERSSEQALGAPELRRTWTDALAHLGALSTAEGADRYVSALASGRAAVAEVRAGAEQAGDRPRVAHATWLEGRLALRDGDRVAAERSFRDAMDLAMEVGESSLRAAATVELVYVVGGDGERTAEALTLADEAEAMLAALGDAPVWTARLSAHRASTLAHARPPRSEQAVEQHTDALERLRARLGDDHPDVIMALGNLGAALRSTGRMDDADARLREAIERAQRVWGPQHPRTARLQSTLGLLRMRQGKLDEARRLQQRSLEVRARALGEDHSEVAEARFNFALVLRLQGEHAEAVEQLQRGLRVKERTRGVDDIGHVEWLLRIGVSELARGRVKEARQTLWRALDLCERFGATPTRFANLRVTLARAYQHEDPATARVLAELARRAWVDDPEENANIDAFLAELAAAEEPTVTAPR